MANFNDAIGIEITIRDFFENLKKDSTENYINATITGNSQPERLYDVNVMWAGNAYWVVYREGSDTGEQIVRPLSDFTQFCVAKDETT